MDYYGDEQSFIPLGMYYGDELSMIPLSANPFYYGLERVFVPSDYIGDVLSFRTRVIEHDGLRLYFDWDGDGHWDVNAIDDFQSASTSIGRDSQLDRAGAGQASITLRDLSRKYVTENPSSPYYPNILPGRGIRLCYVKDQVEWALFTGYLDECLPELHDYKSFLTLSDGTEILARADIGLDIQLDQRSGVIWNKILDIAGWPTARRAIDEGIDIWPVIYTDKSVNSLDLLHRLEQSEFGFRYIGPDGREHWEDRHYRLRDPRCTDPQWVCTARDYANIRPLNPLNSVKNIVILESQPRTKANTATWIWTMAQKAATGDSPSIEPGKTRSFWARFADANGQAVIAGDVMAPSWNSNPDLCSMQANSKADGTGSDLSWVVSIAPLVSGSNLWASSCRIDISNTYNQAIYITQLRVSGYVYVSEGALEIIAEDADSVAKCGRREYRVNVPFYQRAGVLQDIADHIIDVSAWPSPSYEVELCFQRSEDIANQIITRQISDCITLQCEDFGLNDDFYIERIRHEINLDEWRTFWTLSRTDAMRGSYWKLGTSRMGIDTILGY